jgi:hypothetical protein
MRIAWERLISLVLAVLGLTPVLAHAVEKRNVLLFIPNDPALNSGAKVGRRRSRRGRRVAARVSRRLNTETVQNEKGRT